MLQEEIVYATEEVERITKVLDDQSSLLHASQEQTAQKEVILQKVKGFFFLIISMQGKQIINKVKKTLRLF